MTKRLTGINPLAYSGVEASTPPNSVQIRRAPTTQDFYGFNVGDIWINISGYPQTLPTAEDIFYLVAKVNHVATWVNLAGGNALETLTGDTGAPAVGDANDNIQIASAISTGGVFDNLNTVSPGTGSQVLVALNNSIYQPVTNALGTTGVYALGTSGNIVTDRFLHNYGSAGQASHNVFLGNMAGNMTSTGVNNVSMGDSTLLNLTTGTSNSALGSGALTQLTTGLSNCAQGTAALDSLISGNRNVSMGNSSGANLTTGSDNVILGYSALLNGVSGPTTSSFNIAIGSAAGVNYTTSESNNILINNVGTNGESNAIHIGTQGGGVAQQNTCWIAGIRGVTTGVNDAIAVLIDSTGQLGTISSSLRFKENVKDMSDASSGIMKLRPTVFNYKADEKKHIHYGLIAEEVLEFMPDLVVHDQQGPFTVKYNDLIPMLLNEIQKLNKRIEKLEKKKV